MEVNYHAPLLVRRSLDVFAPPQMVWDWISRVELWQHWHPEIGGSKWLGPPGANGAFKLRLRKVVGIVGRVETWEEQKRIGWVADFWWTTWRQVFEIEGDFRSTTVLAEGSLQGKMYSVAAVRTLGLGQLARTNELWLGALKTQLESEKFRVGQRANEG